MSPEEERRRLLEQEVGRVSVVVDMLYFELVGWLVGWLVT